MSVTIKKTKRWKKNITINDLARTTNGLIKNVNKIATSLDDLARMVKEGFDEVHGTIKAGFDKVDNRLTDIEKGQEEIKLRLTNVAYRFELEELGKRVKALEKAVLQKSKR